MISLEDINIYRRIILSQVKHFYNQTIKDIGRGY